MFSYFFGSQKPGKADNASATAEGKNAGGKPTSTSAAAAAKSGKSSTPTTSRQSAAGGPTHAARSPTVRSGGDAKSTVRKEAAQAPANTAPLPRKDDTKKSRSGDVPFPEVLPADDPRSPFNAALRPPSSAPPPTTIVPASVPSTSPTTTTTNTTAAGAAANNSNANNNSSNLPQKLLNVFTPANNADTGSAFFYSNAQVTVVDPSHLSSQDAAYLRKKQNVVLIQIPSHRVHNSYVEYCIEFVVQFEAEEEPERPPPSSMSAADRPKGTSTYTPHGLSVLQDSGTDVGGGTNVSSSLDGLPSLPSHTMCPIDSVDDVVVGSSDAGASRPEDDEDTVTVESPSPSGGGGATSGGVYPRSIRGALRQRRHRHLQAGNYSSPLASSPRNNHLVSSSAPEKATARSVHHYQLHSATSGGNNNGGGAGKGVSSRPRVVTKCQTFRVYRRYQQFKQLDTDLRALVQNFDKQQSKAAPSSTPLASRREDDAGEGGRRWRGAASSAAAAPPTRCAAGYGLLPSLPASHWLEITNQSVELVERRRVLLHIYLQQLLQPTMNLFYVCRTALFSFLHDGATLLPPTSSAAQQCMQLLMERAAAMGGGGVSSSLANFSTRMVPHSTSLGAQADACCYEGLLGLTTLPSWSSCSNATNNNLISGRAGKEGGTGRDVLSPFPSVDNASSSECVPEGKAATAAATTTNHLAKLTSEAAPPKSESSPVYSPLFNRSTHASPSGGSVRGGSLAFPGAATPTDASVAAAVTAVRTVATVPCAACGSVAMAAPPEGGEGGSASRTQGALAAYRCLFCRGVFCPDCIRSLTLPFVHERHRLFAPTAPSLAAACGASGSFAPVAHRNDGTAVEQQQQKNTGSARVCETCWMSYKQCGGGGGDRASGKTATDDTAPDRVKSPVPTKADSSAKRSSTSSPAPSAATADAGNSATSTGAAAAAAAKPDTTIYLEDYQIVTLLGKGNFGHVFKVRERKRRQPRGLKKASSTTGLVSPTTAAAGASAEAASGSGACKRDTSPPGLAAATTSTSSSSSTRRTNKRPLKYFAMKVLDKQKLYEKMMSPYVKEEKDILMMLPQHPFIIHCSQAFQDRQHLYFVLDYLPGGELFNCLYPKISLTKAQVLLYAAELTLAIQHLHRYDVIHRDLKPENVLLTVDGHLCLTDFGLARKNFSQNRIRRRSFVGSAEYVAPEVVKGEVQSFALDWWSFGCLLFEMLFGFTPFHEKDVSTVYESVLHREIDFNRELERSSRLFSAHLRSMEAATGTGGGGGATNRAARPSEWGDPAALVRAALEDEDEDINVRDHRAMLEEMLLLPGTEEAGRSGTLTASPSSSFTYIPDIMKNKERIDINRRITADAISLLQQLLHKDPQKRLQDPEMIKKHPFFRNINWSSVFAKDVAHVASGAEGNAVNRGLSEVKWLKEPDLRDNDTKNFKRCFTAEWPSLLVKSDENAEDSEGLSGGVDDMVASSGLTSPAASPAVESRDRKTAAEDGASRKTRGKNELTEKESDLMLMKVFHNFPVARHRRSRRPEKPPTPSPATSQPQKGPLMDVDGSPLPGGTLSSSLELQATGFQLHMNTPSVAASPSSLPAVRPPVPDTRPLEEMLLRGSWKLRSVRTRARDGRTVFPWGAEVAGLLVYMPNHLFTMQLLPKERACFPTTTTTTTTSGAATITSGAERQQATSASPPPGGDTEEVHTKRAIDLPHVNINLLYSIFSSYSSCFGGYSLVVKDSEEGSTAAGKDGSVEKREPPLNQSGGGRDGRPGTSLEHYISSDVNPNLAKRYLIFSSFRFWTDGADFDNRPDDEADDESREADDALPPMDARGGTEGELKQPPRADKSLSKLSGGGKSASPTTSFPSPSAAAPGGDSKGGGRTSTSTSASEARTCGGESNVEERLLLEMVTPLEYMPGPSLEAQTILVWEKMC